jgi:hypothetical protein
MSEPLINETEARVLGSLIEKELTTPEYYPLTLNSLVNACNQKSNRSPVVSYDETIVQQALETLQEKKLIASIIALGSRVLKYQHEFSKYFQTTKRETAIMCELLLRGPQTAGEIRTRAERMNNFTSLEEALGSLQDLSKRNPPLVTMLPRMQGKKENRFGHLLSGEIILQEENSESQASSTTQKLETLEKTVLEMQNQIEVLKKEFAQFKSQF